LAKLETWRQDTSAAFSKGRRERVVISDGGRVRLGQSSSPVGKLDVEHVWDLARTDQGVIFAATGDAGKVFRRESHDDASWELAFDASDSQAFALTVRADGHVFVGTGPTGQVIDVTDPKHPASRPDPGVQYIWDLAADAKGNIYAATGPTGQLWKLAPDSKWSLELDSKHAHLLCVAIAPDGTVFAGSDGEGLIYRVGPDGKTSVVYDAPQSEIRTLLIAPDGALFAGTATESGGGGGGGSGRASFLLSRDAAPPSGSSPDTSPAQTAAAPDTPTGPGARSGTTSTPSGGSASPRPSSPGDNAVYRIGPDGVPREIFHARALIYALAWQDDRLLIGTGPEGQLYEVRGLGEESAPIARLDNGQILSLLADPQGELFLGAGDPGVVVRLAPGSVARGTLTSDVHDSKLISRFGALTWQAKLPPGTSVAIQVRTGNLGEPDSTWSEWSAEQTDPANSRALVPTGRFVQYRAILSTRDPRVTPELRSVSLRYQTANLPPEITKIDVPDVSASEGTTRQTRLTLRWDVTDPNGDDLNHTLHVRKEGWPDWVRLAPGSVAQGTLTSDVHDSKLISRFGALTWQAKLPPGTSVALQVRTGNLGEPDSTWSDWSAEQTDPSHARALVPLGRFVQYRATLSTRDPHVTPELRSVSLRYQTANLPPEITKVEVPDVSASDGTTRQTRLTLRWDVTDPNGDDLNHTLHVRKEGWPDWVRLGDEPLTSSSYEWDTTSMPAGIYRVRVTSTDRPSNNPADALSRDRESEPFVVDHEAPTVTATPRPSSVTVTLKDNLTRLVKAAYALDGGDWTPIFPEDGLFDTPCETIAITLPDLKPGTHVLVVRATDAAGNVGTGDALIEIPASTPARP
ncbi:MAG: hypothetical protein JO284_06830, partial [Planctomycetaceae bacterium]|nr:hypothetical protein [Planctomycetaceae bacterium]